MTSCKRIHEAMAAAGAAYNLELAQLNGALSPKCVCLNPDTGKRCKSTAKYGDRCQKVAHGYGRFAPRFMSFRPTYNCPHISC